MSCPPVRVLNRLVLRECRTTAELLLRDFGTESALVDIAVLSGMSDLVEQLSESLESLRQKQDAVDARNSAWTKPASLSDVKRSIAAKVNAIMDYIYGNADANPEAFAKLLDNLETILADANQRHIVMQAAAESTPAIALAE